MGGKTDLPAIGQPGQPLRLEGRIRCITDGRFTVTGPMFTGVQIHMGRTVVLIQSDDFSHRYTGEPSMSEFLLRA